MIKPPPWWGADVSKEIYELLLLLVLYLNDYKYKKFSLLINQYDWLDFCVPITKLLSLIIRFVTIFTMSPDQNKLRQCTKTKQQEVKTFECVWNISTWSINKHAYGVANLVAFGVPKICWYTLSEN